MRATAELTSAASRAQEAGRVAASGIRVEVPSDDPIAYARRIALDGRIANIESRDRATSASIDNLTPAESALAGAGDILVRAREIATQMLNGTIDPAQRASAATEVGMLRDALLAQANTRGPSGYLFSGTKIDTAPFDAAGVYQGNLESSRVEMGPGVTIAVSPSGSQAFSAAGGTDVFAALTTLQTALGANDLPSMATALDALDKGHRQVVAERTRIGQILDTLGSAKDEIDLSRVTLTTARAATVEADSTQAFTDLVRTQTAYQQALEVTKRMLAMSAFDR